MKKGKKPRRSPKSRSHIVKIHQGSMDQGGKVPRNFKHYDPAVAATLPWNQE